MDDLLRHAVEILNRTFDSIDGEFCDIFYLKINNFYILKQLKVS